MIEFRNIHKRFGEKEVLRGVSLQVEKGQIQYIIGTSGAGKSVLAKHLVGLMRADSGQILLDGEDITDWNEQAFYKVRRRCATVFQHSTLFDSMTLAENVALPLRKHRGLSHQKALVRAMEYLKQVNMADHGHRFPADVGDTRCHKTRVAARYVTDHTYPP